MFRPIGPVGPSGGSSVSGCSGITARWRGGGRFVWFRKGIVARAVDIFTDDPEAGSFRIHLTSRKKRWLLFDIVEDTPELEELQRLMASGLAAGGGAAWR